jgi:hypothetical protein
MAIDEVTYHRSFLPEDYRFDLRAPNQSTSVDRIRRFGQHPRGLKVFPHPNNTRYTAYTISTQGLMQIEVLQKMDQDFETYATPFEHTWSTLIPHRLRAHDFYPIVDDNLTVTAYTCRTLEANSSHSALIVPIDDLLQSQILSQPNNNNNNLAAFLKAGIRVFVTPHALVITDNRDVPTTRRIYTAPTGWRTWKFSSNFPYTSCLVRTLLDGEVYHLEFHGVPRGDVEAAGFTPFDLLALGPIVVYLGVKVGSRLVRALFRKRDARRLLNGPTEDLAKQSQAAVKKLLRGPSPRKVVIKPKHPRVKGEPDPKITNKMDQDREVHAANRYAERGDVADVYLGDAARKQYNAPDGKFADVVALKRDGTFALSEGKGTAIDKMLEQFAATKSKLNAHKQRLTGNKNDTVIVSEYEVVVQKLTKEPVDGGVLHSPGPGFGIDDHGYLLEARGYVNLKNGLPPRAMVPGDGKPVKVIVIEDEGNIIGRNIVGGDRSPAPK